MAGLKRKIGANASTATESSDTNPSANESASSNRPAKRNCRQPTEPLHMVTRRSASIAASVQNSGVSSAIQSEAEDGWASTAQDGLVSTDNTKSRKAKSSAQTQIQSRTRVSATGKKAKAEAPKLKLFVAKPPAKAAAGPAKIWIRTASPGPEAQPLTASLKRRRSAEDEDGETGNLADMADNANGGPNGESLEANTINPPAKRRGRFPKQRAELVDTSAEQTPAPETSAGNPEIPAIVVKRPPGRPRKVKPQVDAEASETTSKRLPGRQRAPDTNPRVEAIRQRQQELKANYRVVAKAQKAGLDNLASRAINKLKGKPHAHVNTAEFRLVNAELDACLADNLAEIEKSYRREKDYEERKYRSEEAVLKEECKKRREDIQEAFITKVKDEYMRCVQARQARSDQECTDDERLKEPKDSGNSKSGVYNPHSSRFNYEVKCVWRDWQKRLALQGTLLAINLSDPRVLPRAFTATDQGRHEAAVAATNLDILALATEVADDLPLEEALPRVRSEGEKQGQEVMERGLYELAFCAEFYSAQELSKKRGKKGGKKEREREQEDAEYLELCLQRAQRHGMEFLQEANEEAFEKVVKSHGARHREIRPAPPPAPSFPDALAPPMVYYHPAQRPPPPQMMPPPPLPPPQLMPPPPPHMMPPPPQMLPPAIPPPYYRSQGLMNPPPLPPPAPSSYWRHW